MKNLPIGIQTFSKLRNGDYLYVDKTQEIFNLLADGGQYYFISRPRRFGKSLMISTLKEIFSGNKQLFKGLWIYDKIEWQSFPVIHLDFLTLNGKTPELLEKSLVKMIQKIARRFDVELDPDGDCKDMFGELIEETAEKNSKEVVILIDEYDKPILDHLNSIDSMGKNVAKENRKVLKSFFSIIKAMDEHLKFVLLTGVSKFSKVSIFSDLNNLNDITIDERFSTLMGCTQEELEYYFDDRLEILAQARGMDKKDTLSKVKTWYNGYSWDGRNFLYNTFSLLLLFDNNFFDNYWFSTGTPTFLIRLIKDKNVEVMEFENLKSGAYIFDVESIEVVALMFQTGYLTIKKVETSTAQESGNIYYWDYPNLEVKQSFLRHLQGFQVSENIF